MQPSHPHKGLISPSQCKCYPICWQDCRLTISSFFSIDTCIFLFLPTKEVSHDHKENAINYVSTTVDLLNYLYLSFPLTPLSYLSCRRRRYLTTTIKMLFTISASLHFQIPLPDDKGKKNGDYRLRLPGLFCIVFIVADIVLPCKLRRHLRSRYIWLDELL